MGVEEGFIINGGWRRYWVINEQGRKEEISRAKFKIIFETETQQLRDKKNRRFIKIKYNYV